MAARLAAAKKACAAAERAAASSKLDGNFYCIGLLEHKGQKFHPPSCASTIPNTFYGPTWTHEQKKHQIFSECSLRTRWFCTRTRLLLRQGVLRVQVGAVLRVYPPLVLLPSTSDPVQAHALREHKHGGINNAPGIENVTLQR